MPRPRALTQDQALAAVQSGHATPLAELANQIETSNNGRVIDAELLSVRGMLVYALKVLSASGKLGTQYYYARSGSYIGSE
ncbi:hypothetical protein IC608_09465 [Devosia sp. PTR5]|uniref:Uncharacterized protein n=1 Tax=Devosia oryzisoli TaxID=2774138 RepID=A0A927ITB3_9HYPH|nr:hypothetical protein [Devosia oryzisoli]MBD8065702.1 hypothetical protein [Devosia oryzisoli]